MWVPLFWGKIYLWQQILGEKQTTKVESLHLKLDGKKATDFWSRPFLDFN